MGFTILLYIGQWDGYAQEPEREEIPQPPKHRLNILLFCHHNGRTHKHTHTHTHADEHGTQQRVDTDTQ